MTIETRRWFSEDCVECGTSFSIAIKQKIHDEQSPYQHIEIYETETFGNLMTLDGLVMVTALDNFIYHEMICHPALFSHPDPKRVLVVGGGDCGTLCETLKHPEVEQVDQVEIDERVTRVSERFFPELCKSNQDGRAHFHFTDAIEWVKQAPDRHYDVIIVDSTDPIGPAVGLFSETFYKDCLRVLTDKGVLVAQSESPLFHMPIICNMHLAMSGAGYTDIATLHFPQCSYPSGWWTVTLACKNNGLDNFRKQDAQKKSFTTRYYDAAIHQSAKALPPFMYDALQSNK